MVWLRIPDIVPAQLQRMAEKFLLTPNRQLFRFVTTIQDEVHSLQSPISKNVHKKESFSVRLTECEGIRPKKATALLKNFEQKSTERGQFGRITRGC